MNETDSPSPPSVSRRKVLAATATTTLAATAGCSQVTNLFSSGLDSCSGSQRDVPPLQIGNAESSVTVTEFVDYACPHCADFALDIFPKIRQQYVRNGKIEYIQRDYPLPVSDWSTPVANAVHSVQEQVSNKAAVDFSKVMFEQGQKKDAYSMDFIEQQANDTEADAGQVRTAANKKPYCQVIRKNKQMGNDRGVSGTPTLFVNDQMLEAPSLDELTTTINNAL